MKKEIKTVIKFDGPILKDHRISANELIPSLLALTEVLELSNTKFNKDRTKVKLLIKANIDQNCFELELSLVQYILENLQKFLGKDTVTIKEIGTLIGIIGGPTIAYSLYRLITFLKGKNIQSIKENSGNKVEIKVKGNNNTIVIDPKVYGMYSDRKIRQKCLDVLEPLKREGYESLEFYHKDKSFQKITKKDVPESIEDTPDLVEKKEITTRKYVSIKKAVYEDYAKWSMISDNRTIDVSIKDSKWLKKFQKNKIKAPPTSSLEVDLKMIVYIDEKGKIVEEPIYEITKVHQVALPESEGRIF